MKSLYFVGVLGLTVGLAIFFWYKGSYDEA
jgi:hypothetical protein